MKTNEALFGSSHYRGECPVTLSTGKGAMLAKVLVVDDQADVRSLLTIVLLAYPRIGSIVEAEDGLAALELVRRERPDLVIVDVMMPRLDGLAVTRRIQQDWPSTRLVVPSSLAYPQMR